MSDRCMLLHPPAYSLLLFAYKTTYRVLVQVLLKVGCAGHAERVCRLLQPQAHTGGSSGPGTATASATPSDLSRGSPLATTEPAKQLPSTAASPSDKPSHNPVTAAEPGKQPEAPSTMVEGANITTESLERNIEKEIQELEEEFSSVVMKAALDLEKIELSLVKLHITTQLPVSIKHQHIKFLQDNLPAISNAKSVQEIFSILALYWDFLNCGLLNEIVRRLGNHETKQLMDQYMERLREFRVKTKLGDFIGKWARCCPPHFSELITELPGEWSEHTLEDLENLRIELARTICVEGYALPCISTKPGSVTVTWAIPSSLPGIADTLQSIFLLLEEEYDVLAIVFQGRRIPELSELAPLEVPSDSGVELEQDVRVTEKDRERRHQRVLELHQRREKELLLELRKKQEPNPKQQRPRHQKKQEPSREPQGSVATAQNATQLQPCGDFLFHTKVGAFIARADCMFIASVGSEHPASVKTEHKPSDTIRAQRVLKTHGRLPHTVTRLPQGTEVDLIVVSSIMKRDPLKELVSLNLDLPGRERSRDYYLQEMEKIMRECDKPGAYIWYTGHSKQGTGDWCFKDGTISFQDIFDLYTTHFSGRLLTIVSDCCYSGKWVDVCAETLDSMGIPPCGHKARERGVMIKIAASCLPDQRAGDPCYSVEGVEFSEEDQGMYFRFKQLTESQTSTGANFTKLVCCKGPDDACPAESAFKNWKWADAMSGKMRRNWYTVRGKVRGRPSWYYVLLSSGDEEYRAQFKASKVATGHIDVADWGYVLASGWGKDPPQSITDKFDLWTWVGR